MWAAISTIFVVAAPRGRWYEALDGLAQMAMLFAAVLLLIYSVRIKVRESDISVIRYFFSERKVQFTEITHSTPHSMAKRNHPLWLDLYGSDKSPVLRLPLKTLRKQDVEWLLSLPQLKVRR
jgi:hypothetical protein